MSAKTKKTLDSVLEDHQVEQFLREHPDFFERHLPLLDILRIPHPAHGTVSLLERQVARLRETHRNHERQLAELITHAHNSERISQQLINLACTLMRADSTDSILALTQEALRLELQAEFVRIALLTENCDPLHRLDPAAEKMLDPVFQNRKVRSGRLPKNMLKTLFGEIAPQVESSVLVPLIGDTEKIGILALGSRSREQFGPDVGTHFISQLGALLAESIRCRSTSPGHDPLTD